ncbi:MAG: hypothetical protein ACOYEW_04900, partial [Anaerolineae bacterium]
MGDTRGVIADCAAQLRTGLIAGGQGSALASAIACYRRGLDDPLPPETATDEGLFWSGRLLGERGLDITIDLGAGQFVDRVIIHQSAAPTGTARPSSRSPQGQDIEAAERLVTAGIGKVVALVRPAPSQPVAPAARQAALNQGALPETITLELGVDASEIVLSLDSYRRDIGISAIEVWGGAQGEPRIYPQPVRFQVLPAPPFPLTPET